MKTTTNALHAPKLRSKEHLIPCCLDGLRGTTIDLPQEAIDDLTAPGSCDSAAEYWSQSKPIADQLDAIGDAAVVLALIETGAWSREDLEADREVTRQRAVWVAAGSAEEPEETDEPAELPRVLAIETTYHGPTNHRGSRISAKLLGRGEGGKATARVFVDRCDDLGIEENHQRAAEVCLHKWLDGFNHPTTGRLEAVAGIERGYLFTASTRSL